MRKYLPVAFLFIFFCVAAVDAGAQTVSGSIGKGTVARGATTRASVVLKIPGGLHVNSRYPNSKYAIATTVTVSAKGVTLGGVSYPRGKNRRFSFSENTINVYEGRVVFGFNVKVPKGYAGKTVKVRAKVRYQACTDEVCYAPTSKEVTFTAKVQ